MRLLSRAAVALAISALTYPTVALDPTDCIQEACEPYQQGYTTTHNLDPAVVGSAQFGTLWQFYAGFKETILSQPLVYTAAGKAQVVIAATENNNVYVLDAATGTKIASTNLGAPFTAVDANCADVTPNIGVTSTGIIDPATNTYYVVSKTYAPGQTGTLGGRFRVHALDTWTLQERPGFPVELEGTVPWNNPAVKFQSGYQMQRAGLTIMKGVVYIAFAGHCDNFQYYGHVIGVNIATGAIANAFTAEAGSTYDKGAGIWQAGGALATDGNSMWFVTGNGQGTALKSSPVFGYNPPGALPQSVVRVTLNSSNNQLYAADFFTPYDYANTNAADQDFGSSGVAILPSGFSTPTVSRIAIA